MGTRQRMEEWMDMKNPYDDAWRKLETAPHPQFDPVLFKWGKLSNRGGMLLELDRIYSSMYHLWPTLQKDVNDITDAVSLLDWSVSPFVRDGRVPDKKAQEVADTVSCALWQVMPQEPGTYSRSFLDLVGAVVHALYRGQNVHQIIWARTPELVYPAEYRQLLPQYYLWETRSGERDRLLLAPDGSSYGNAVPFAPYQYIVALNTLGPDHPLYNGVFYSLAGYFGAAAYGLPWLQDYCLRYGHPVRKFSVQNEADEAKLREELQKYPDVTDVFLQPGRELEITPIPAGAGIPHEALLRLAENMCHQCILGQTLTSDASAQGGSRAQAQVHAGVQAEVVLKRAEFVCRILNRQLIPAIVYMNYGRVEGVPMPELKCSVPDEGVNLERIQALKEFLSIPGAKVARSFVHEFTRIPMPGEGDEVYGGESGEASLPPGLSEKKTAGGGADDVSAAKADTGSGAGALEAEAWEQWAKPVVDALEGWLDEGMEPGRIRSRLQETAPDTDALAAAFSAVPGSGLGADAAVRKGEKVAAAHCNQYGHKPGCSKGEGAVPAENAGEVHSADSRMPGSLPKDWRPLSFTGIITPEAAREKLKKGVSVTDPTGHKVRLDETLLEHWKEAGKTEEDIQERLASLPIARKALAHPNEIWLDEKSGVRTYLAATLDVNRKAYVIAFTLGGENNGILQTYRPESRNINSKRQGKLIYSQQKKGGAR